MLASASTSLTCYLSVSHQLQPPSLQEIWHRSAISVTGAAHRESKGHRRHLRTINMTKLIPPCCQHQSIYLVIIFLTGCRRWLVSNNRSVLCSSRGQKPEIKCGWGLVPTALPVKESFLPFSASGPGGGLWGSSCSGVGVGLLVLPGLWLHDSSFCFCPHITFLNSVCVCPHLLSFV